MKSGRLHIVHAVFASLPATRFFKLKALLLRWAGATVGSNVRVISSARFFQSGSLSIGDGTCIGHEALIVGGDASVSIGRNVDIAPGVSIVTGTHELFKNSGSCCRPRLFFTYSDRRRYLDWCFSDNFTWNYHQ